MSSEAKAVSAGGVSTEVGRGMRTFLIIWSGQLVSLIGSGLTRFALGVWVFETTGRATPFALALLFGSLPAIILAPLAGTVVDRLNRRMIMIAADVGAALATLFAAAMVFSGQLQIWHIYLIAALSSAFGAFQEPAYQSSITMLVAKKDFARASGLLQTAQAIELLASPVLAGFLFVAIGLEGIILIDFATFFFAVGALLFVRIPQPEVSDDVKAARGSMAKELRYGIDYLLARVGLFTMLLYFASVNFFLGFGSALLPPMILSFADADVLGILQGVMGVGMLAGSIAISAWGGPKRKMNGVYLFIGVFGIGYVLAGLRASPVLIGLGMFLVLGSVPMASASSQAIWMSKVAPDVQGRVFSVRAMIARFMMPLAFILVGPLADGVFEPLLAPGGALADNVGRIIGTGPGRGIGLMFILVGILLTIVTLLAYSYPRMRLVEDELPDVIPDAPPADLVA